MDQNDPSEEGFLGGTLTGREFWRGMRGGGSIGAKAFKAHCLKNNPSTSATPHKRATASTIKADVYNGCRDALRSVNLTDQVVFFVFHAGELAEQRVVYEPPK